MRLLIGTPAYGGMVHLDYLNSLLALGIPVHVTDAVTVTHYGTHGFRMPRGATPKE